MYDLPAAKQGSKVAGLAHTLRVEQVTIVTNSVPEVKNRVFRVKMGNLAKRYTGASLA